MAAHFQCPPETTARVFRCLKPEYSYSRLTNITGKELNIVEKVTGNLHICSAKCCRPHLTKSNSKASHQCTCDFLSCDWNLHSFVLRTCLSHGSLVAQIIFYYAYAKENAQRLIYIFSQLAITSNKVFEKGQRDSTISQRTW